MPQPLSIQSHYKTYVAHLMDKSITDPQAIALRAMFGNQKELIEQVHAMLVGDAGRGNENNMRDRTFDVLKGLLTLEGGPKYSWMTFALVGFSGGHLTALSAGVFRLMRDGAQAATYVQKLPLLTLEQNTVLMAIEAAAKKNELNMPVLVKREVTAEEALRRIKGAPAGTYSRADRVHYEQNKSKVVLFELSDVNTESGAITPRSDEPGRIGGHSPNSRGSQGLAALQVRAKALGAKPAGPADIQVAVRQYGEIDAAKLMGEARVDKWLGIGSMIVQAIGLYHAIPDLRKELNSKGPGGAKLRDAMLGAFDGGLGFGGAAADMLHGARKAALMKQGGKQLVQLNTSLMVLKTVAGLAGMASGALNVVMSAYKAGEAKSKGDMEAYYAYGTAATMFGGTMITSAIAAGDAASRGAVSRFIARKVLLRAAGVVATEAAVATAAATVVAVVSGVGTVLLIVGIASTVYAIVTTPDELQRWARRTYFGKGGGDKPQFASSAEEDAGLDQVFKDIEAQEKAAKEAAAKEALEAQLRVEHRRAAEFQRTW